MNLADIATDQMQATSFRRYPRKSPLAEEIHAELPAKLQEGQIKAETELVEKELEQREEQSLAELAAAEEQANKSEGVTAIGMGLSGAKMLNEFGGDIADYSSGAAGFGIGYGVGKYTGNKWAGAAAGAGVAAIGSYLKGSTAVDSVINTIVGFLGGMI